MATSNYNSSTDFLQKLADKAELEVQNTRSMIWNLSDPGGGQAVLRDPDFAYTPTRPNLGPAPTLTDVLGVNDTTAPWLQQLNADADAWVQKYFPSLDDCLKSLPEEWLCGVISGVKPFGLDATVFEIVWHRARDRAYRTMASEQTTLEAAFAHRGFSIPPGALVAQMAATSERAGDAIAEVNREQAIKEAEIKLDILKFAEQQALQYKLGIMQTLADFFRQWISLPDKDLERARIKAQANSALYAALSSYYNVELAFEELKLKAQQTDVQTDLSADRNRIDNMQASNRAGKAQALAQAAQAFGDISAQAAASAGSLVAQIENL